MIERKAPIAEANRLSKMLSAVLGAERFPVDVKALAKEYSQRCFSDPITEITGAALPRFEGMLKASQDNKRWLIVYNDKTSPGRIRFTLAHEFGHYLLHRLKQRLFECSDLDMHSWDSQERALEAEADVFASFLLMPLDDFRSRVDVSKPSLEHLRDLADKRYGVSLSAISLKWIEIAEVRAVVVAARDGFINWARSSPKAFRSGVFLKTRGAPIQVPSGSLLGHVERGFETRDMDAQEWFPREPSGTVLTETVYVSEKTGHSLALLTLPSADYSHLLDVEAEVDESTLSDEVRSGRFPSR